jgi:uncharacterized BrkB/YihY/UPF0761 family membrane protein
MIECFKKNYNQNRFYVKDAWQILKEVYAKYTIKDLMQSACALSHRTLLAIVPLLAMIFAIARGFNVQDFLKEQLIEHFSSQKEAITYAVSFVDSYLEHTTDGVFIGVGIVALILRYIFCLMPLNAHSIGYGNAKREHSHESLATIRQYCFGFRF